MRKESIDMFTLNDLEKLYSQNPNVQFKKE
jgi:hypothetical protein